MSLGGGPWACTHRPRASHLTSPIWARYLLSPLVTTTRPPFQAGPFVLRSSENQPSPPLRLPSASPSVHSRFRRNIDPPIPGDSFQGRASAVPGWQRGWLGGPGVWARLESSPRPGSGRAPSSLRSSYCSISQGSQSWGLVSTPGEQLAAGARGLHGRAYPTARHGTPGPRWRACRKCTTPCRGQGHHGGSGGLSAEADGPP